MSVYADTSFLVSLYLPDQHSKGAHLLMTKHPTIWLTPLHRVEWAHAVAQHVFQRKISSLEYQRVTQDFNQDRKMRLWAETNLPEMAFETCAELADRFVGRLGARTLDSLHVAAAKELKADVFWTFDARQAKLAEAAGLNLL